MHLIIGDGGRSLSLVAPRAACALNGTHHSFPVACRHSPCDRHKTNPHSCLALRAGQPACASNLHSVRQLDEILASNPSAIFTFDLTGDVTYANARAFELLGVKTGDRRGVDFDSSRWERRTLEGEALPEELTPFRRAVAERKGFSDWRYRLRLPDGRWRVVTTTAVPLLDARGAISSVVVTTTDLTDQTRLEHDTRQAQKASRDSASSRGWCRARLQQSSHRHLRVHCSTSLEQNVATSNPGVRADIEGDTLRRGTRERGSRGNC